MNESHISLSEVIGKSLELNLFRNLFNSNQYKYYSFFEDVELSTHVCNLEIFDWHELQIFCWPSDPINHKEVIDNILRIKPDESYESHLEKLKKYYIDTYGPMWSFVRSNSLEEINPKVIEQYFLQRLENKIPKNTHDTIIYSDPFRGDKSSYKFSGINPIDLTLDKILVANKSDNKPEQTSKVHLDTSGNKWEVAKDFSFLKGPNIEVKVKSVTALNVLKAILKLNCKSKTGYFLSRDVFNEAQEYVYEMRLSQFIKNNRSFKQILFYHENIKSYSTPIPRDFNAL